jgi:hypothetical protein
MAAPERLVPRFAAEPAQAPLPGGAWAERLHGEFLTACLELEDPLGEPGTPLWYPDRTWSGRTYVPVTCRTTSGLELYGAVSFAPIVDAGQEHDHFRATAAWTEETADLNPDWVIDLCEEVVGGWRGAQGRVAAMTLIWGRPLVHGGSTAVAELGGLVVDQCALVEGRFTLLAPDDVDGDTLSVAVLDRDGRELARESLYAEDEDEAS